MSDFGIYVHWPFCAAKCPYCDFNSHVRTQLDEAGWVASIMQELRSVAALQEIRPQVDAIFFGGGTPSLMRGAAVAQVLETIAALWPLAENIEITLESNPASVEAARFRDYRAAGVNRLSLGVQALNDADLQMLGRLHDAQEAKSAIRLAQSTFERVSFDLIYARPDQTMAQWGAELREGLAFGTEHLSLYQLTIEPQTPFATLARQGKLIIPDDERAVALYEVTQEITEAAGLPAYEISNHARLGAESRHNLIYWRYGDYVGVGPGAHGRLSLREGRIATQCEALPERWQARVAEQGFGFARQPIDDVSAAREHLLMHLRLREGIDLAAYGQRWGAAPEQARLDPLIEGGWLVQDGARIRATPKGRLVLNSVIAELAV